MRERQVPPRLLADENTSHRLVSACRRRVNGFPIVHIASWQDGLWLGLDDASMLVACADAGLVLVAFDRATLPWHAGQVIRHGEDHGSADTLPPHGAQHGLRIPGAPLDRFLARGGRSLGLAQPHRLSPQGTPRQLAAHLAAAATFAILAIVLTWPLARRLTTAIPGGGAGDNVTFLWNFWWMRQALVLRAGCSVLGAGSGAVVLSARCGTRHWALRHLTPAPST